MARRLATLALAAALGCGGVEAGGDAPAIEAIDPAVGPQGGGLAVTVTGRNFDFSPEVPPRVALGNSVAEATVVDANTITFTSPPGAEGVVDVVVFHAGGASVAPAAFRYAPLPGVASIDPALGGEGTLVTIRGRGFVNDLAGAVSVTIDGAPLTGVTVDSDSQITATLPAAPGETFVPVDVEVTTGNGADTLSGGFRFSRPGLLALSYAIRRQPRPDWYFVDTTTGALTLVGRSNAPISKATVAANGDVFALVDAIGIAQIGRLDADLDVVEQRTLATTPIGGDIEVDNGETFVLDRRNSLLRRYNGAGVEQAAPTAAILARSVQPTCIFRNDATTLFLIQRLDGPLSLINKAAGTLATVATLDGPTDEGCHGATRIGNEVFVVGVDTVNGDRDLSALYRLDTATGQLAFVADMRIDGVMPIRVKAIIPTPPGF